MTIANYVTLSRLALAPVIYALYLQGHFFWATVVFVAAALTDTADGWLARRRGEISRVGILLDPIADKVLILAILWAEVAGGYVPGWLFALLLIKEAALVLGGALLLRRKQVVAARFLGKAGSICLFIAIGGGLSGFYWLRPLLYLGAALSLAAGCDYAIQAVRRAGDA